MDGVADSFMNLIRYSWVGTNKEIAGSSFSIGATVTNVPLFSNFASNMNKVICLLLFTW